MSKYFQRKILSELFAFRCNIVEVNICANLKKKITKKSQLSELLSYTLSKFHVKILDASSFKIIQVSE